MNQKKDLSTQDLENLDLIDKYDDPLTGYNSLSWKNYILLYVILVISIFVIIWANFAHVDELARGMGKIIPSSEVQVIQNLEGGIVKKIHVSEGETVEAGQILAQLSDITAGGEYQASLKRYMNLKASITRLTAEANEQDFVEFPLDLKQDAPDLVNLEKSIFEANRSQAQNQRKVLEQQLKQREQEIVEIRERIKGLEKVYALSQEEYEMIKPLAERGTVSKVELLQVESRAESQKAELNNYKTTLIRAEAAAEEARKRIDEQAATLKAEAQKQISSLQAELNTLEETLASYEDRSKRTELTSPVYGIVNDIKISTVGGVVQPGETIMEVVPLNDQLIIEGNISPTDIAFIHPGQSAIIKLTAYDYTIYGTIPAKVIDISADTFENDRGEVFYRVKLQSDKTTLSYKGENLPIIPGMIANVDILTGEKTVMSYLLKPFKKTITNALHER